MVWKKLKKSDMCLVLGLNAIFILISFLFMPLNETNDDMGMMALLSGAYGKSGYHMVFTNVIYAIPLKTMYQCLPGINWYSVFQLILMTISFQILGVLLLKRCGRKKGFVLTVFLFFFFATEFFFIYQFTRVSILCCAAGYAYLIFHLKKEQYARAGLGAVLVWIGSLIRMSGFEVATIFALSLGVYEFLLEKDMWRHFFRYGKENAGRLLRAVLFFAILFGVCFGSRALNQMYYNRDTEWKEYMEYTRLRAKLTDYGWPSYGENRSFYESLGISYNDYEMYVTANMADKDLLSVDKIEQIVRYKEQTNHRTTSLAGFFKFAFQNIYIRQCILLYSVLLSVYFYFYQKKWKNVILLILNAVIFLGTSYYYYLIGRTVERVVVPTMFFAVFIALYAYKKEDWKNRQLLRVHWLAVILLLLICYVSPGEIRYVYLYTTRENGARDYDSVLQEKEENLYIADLNLIRYNYKFFHAYHYLEPGIYHNQLNIGGWLSRTPVLEKLKEEAGVNNIPHSLLTKENTYFFTKDMEWIMKRYLEEHYTKEELSYAAIRITKLGKVIAYTENTEEIRAKEGGKLAIVSCQEQKEFDDYWEAVFEPEDQSHTFMTKNKKPLEKNYIRVWNLKTNEVWVYRCVINEGKLVLMVPKRDLQSAMEKGNYEYEWFVE